MRNKEKNKKKLKTNDKIHYLSLFLAFLFLVYIFRLFNLQILDKDNYRSKGNKVSRIGNVVNPDRGNIFDRNGNPLAVTQKIDSLYLLPAISKEKSLAAENIRKNEEQFNNLSEEEKEEVVKLSSLPTYNETEIEKLSNILSIDKNEILGKLDKSEEGFIYRALNKAQKSQIEVLNLNYIRVVSVDERYYPNKEVSSSILGFVENNEGQYGLEKYYNTVLSGKSGYKEFYKALHGTEIPFSGSDDKKAEDADNLKTTLDIELQNILYKNLKDALIYNKAMSASAILMDPNNGEVLAMESLPTFDANNPRDLSNDIDKTFVEKMEGDEHLDYLYSKWNNKNVSFEYDPGSVFKVLTSAIALEVDNSLKDKIYEDKGFYNLAPGVVIKSWRYWDPFGKQTMKEALKNSSNPVFVDIAKDIGKKRFIDYGHSFRLGQKTQIDLPSEITGYFPKDENISDVDFGTMSYGHHTTVSPIQIMSSLNSAINGGKYFKPTVAKEILDKNNKPVYKLPENFMGKTISESTSKEIRDYMEYTAENYGLNTKDVKFGAKTGTTIKYNTNSKFNEDGQEPIVASIYITYPADNPKYSLILVIDEPLSNYATTSATPFAKKIMYEVAERDLGEPIKVENDEKLISVPDLVGLTFMEASNEIEDININLSTKQKIGMFNIIKNQTPLRDDLIEENSVISLEFEDKIKVPNLIDQDIELVKKLLDRNLVKYEIKGEGNKVIKQSKKSGEIIDIKEKIILEVGGDSE